MWSIDSNGRLLEVNYNSSNIIPLYFLLSGDQILMDSFAKDSFNKNVENSFGDFWQNSASNMLEYERFGKKYKFDTLLSYTLKESILPSIVKSHFHCGNLSEFLTQFNTLIAFESFIDQEQQEKINKNLLEIVGYNPNALILIDFWEHYKEVLIKKNTITRNDSFVVVNGSLGNIYLHLIGKNSPSQLSKSVLIGKGHDPRVDTILDFLSEIARAKGSIVSQSDIKKELVSDAEVIINKLSDGYVMHTIKNNKIGINPLNIGFHRDEIDGRLNNRQSLNFIQNEFDAFRKNNNAENLGIILSGSVINQPVFKDFFSSTYSKVHSESEGFEMEFILRCLEKNRISDPPPLKTTTEVPPSVDSKNNTTPVDKVPPVIQIPPGTGNKGTKDDIKKSEIPPTVPPGVPIPPPIPKEVKKVVVPPPLSPKTKVPPPPPPLPIKKK